MSWIDVPPHSPLAEPHPESPPVRREAFASWLLGAPLAVALGGLALFQLATWVPHYLTWPFWADHDVFATLARGWELGRLPYRDLRCNNFPGQMYVFWILGKLGGWGRTWPFFALDVGLLAGFGALLVAWARRRLGSAVPGLVGYLAFLSYYLGLDYSLTGQRDWHGPLFAAAGLLAVQAWPGRAGRALAALGMAAAFAFRPQTVLFGPAVALSVFESARGEGASARGALRVLAGWMLAASGLVALSFAPLLAAGVFGDFVRGVRLAAYGGRYSRVTPFSAARDWLLQASHLRVLVVPAALVLLAPPRGASARGVVRAWLLALALVSLYRPLSPMPHAYLDIPLRLVWSIGLGVLAALVLAQGRAPASLRLVAILAIASMVTAVRPDSCALGPSVRAFAALRRGEPPEEVPPGYRRGPSSSPTAAYYSWADYRALLSYLRGATGPTTRVANALKGDPAVTGPSGRPPAFGAEAVAWLRMVCPEDEAEFAAALAAAPADSVVVWAPGDPGPVPGFRLARLEPAIRRLYRPEARFGVIEVWRREPGEGAAPSAAGASVARR